MVNIHGDITGSKKISKLHHAFTTSTTQTKEATMEDGQDKETARNLDMFHKGGHNSGVTNLSDVIRALDEIRRKIRFHSVSTRKGFVETHSLLGHEQTIILN